MSNNGPSNIRINPFTGDGGATTYVNLTETHIIPSTSPFVVRLNEVPEKQDPSNMKCVWVDSSTGDVTSNALTEVAATPSAGEFRPDYSTKADGNDNWNTGLIEFNSADAGKIVQITYTGMGTLAAVQSNKYPSWYTDRGDGSDDDFVPTKNTTISGVKNYKSVFIKAGITVTVNKNAVIKVLHSFTNLGTIKSTGASGGKGGAFVSDREDSSGFGTKGGAGTISAGGAGGAGGSRHDYTGGAGGSRSYFSAISMDDAVMKNICENIGFVGIGGAGGGGGGGTTGFGSGSGGTGGAGGGSICIVCEEFNNKGTVTSSGSKGGNATGGNKYGPGGGGGGGGGAVFVFANVIVSKGTITAAGGAGGSGSAGGYNGANGGNGFTKICELGV